MNDDYSDELAFDPPADFTRHWAIDYEESASFAADYEFESRPERIYPLHVPPEGRAPVGVQANLIEPIANCRRTVPLRAAYIGPNFRIGGVRQHAIALARFLDPKVIHLDRFLVTDSSDDWHAEDCGLPAPISLCDSDSLRQVSAECDIVLSWGHGLDPLLQLDGPLRVFVAHGETGWTRNLLESMAPAIDHVIAVSTRVRDRICHGFAATTILNGVDTARLSQSDSSQAIRRRLAFHGDDFVIGCVGRLTREKHFDRVIEAVAQLPSCFKLLLVGSGRRRTELLEMANALIPARFAMVSADDYLGDYYAAMDALAMVSAHEGFSLVVAEAMMCGRPVIATPVGCVPELIEDRVSGVIVDSTAESIASAASRLRDHPRWARGIAEEGREIAQTRLHASRMARDYERLLCQLVANQSLSKNGMAS